MYTLLRLVPVKRFVYEQVPALSLAWIAAEFFYKFHSFTLECAAFLATWFIVDVAIQAASRMLTRSTSRTRLAD